MYLRVELLAAEIQHEALERVLLVSALAAEVGGDPGVRGVARARPVDILAFVHDAVALAEVALLGLLQEVLDDELEVALLALDVVLGRSGRVREHAPHLIGALVAHAHVPGHGGIEDVAVGAALEVEEVLEARPQQAALVDDLVRVARGTSAAR